MDLKNCKSENKRIVIAAASSSSGKTMVSCGLIALFKSRGYKVAAMKCGPDYIDPMFHRQVLGVPSGNLDTFLSDRETVRHLVDKVSSKADITIIEGVMGFYDGLGGVSQEASTYDVATASASPVILVVDAKGSSVTLASVIQGIAGFEADSNIKGIFLNRVSSGFYPTIKDFIEERCKIPVVGYLPELKDMEIPSRHLGLVSPDEIAGFSRWTERLAKEMSSSVDIDGVIRIASSHDTEDYSRPVQLSSQGESIRIAIARDEAFSFYYEENVMLLRQLGVCPVYFSPLNDDRLPENVCGLILWGGYPENYAYRLSANDGMRHSIYDACKSGMPCIAECGGFLYLGKELEGADGRVYEMAGVLDGKGYRTDRLVRFGYIEVRQRQEMTGNNVSLLLGNDCHMRGHEFHYWDSTDNGSSFSAARPLKPDRTYNCIVHTETIFAGFPHFYYYSNTDAISCFVEKCRKYGGST